MAVTVYNEPSKACKLGFSVLLAWATAKRHGTLHTLRTFHVFSQETQCSLVRGRDYRYFQRLTRKIKRKRTLVYRYIRRSLAKKDERYKTGIGLYKCVL